MVEVGPTLRLWAIQDANFNVVALVDSSGSVVERYDYTPFGAVTIMNASGTLLSSSAYGMVYLWQGMRLDVITGNYAAQNRDYNVALQRWMTLDPTGLSAGDPNMYRSEANNIVKFTDPSGLQINPNQSIPTSSGIWEGSSPRNPGKGQPNVILWIR